MDTPQYFEEDGHIPLTSSLANASNSHVGRSHDPSYIGRSPNSLSPLTASNT